MAGILFSLHISALAPIAARLDLTFPEAFLKTKGQTRRCRSMGCGSRTTTSFGAAVNVVVKSGTNRIHGGAFEFIRNDHLDARNYFASPPPSPKPGFKRNQFGFFLGGPLKKDKTFIFGDYQGSRVREALSYVSTVPNAAERSGDFRDRLS